VNLGRPVFHAVGLVLFFAKGIYHRIFKEEIQILGSAIAFNAILCAIPLVLLMTSLVGVFLNSSEIAVQHIGEILDTAFPDQQSALQLKSQVKELIGDIVRYRTSIGLVGFSILIWTATSLFSACRSVLNTIYKVESKKLVIRKILEDILWVIVIGVLFIATSLVTWIGSLIDSTLRGMSESLNVNIVLFLDAFPVVLAILLVFLMFFLLYRFIPDQGVSTLIAAISSLTSTTLWWWASKTFGWYIATYHSYSRLYGTYAFVLVLLVWCYYSAIVFIFGAIVGQLSKEYSHSRTTPVAG
jgi:membrane protein